MNTHSPIHSSANKQFSLRIATLDDVDDLVAIENICFDSDGLNKRSFRRWIQAEHGILLLAENINNKIVAYGLVWCPKGTRHARLYSLAILPNQRGLGLAPFLLNQLELAAADRGRLFMRLEVANHNKAAIRLYETNGYRIFGEYFDYYEDHSDALRMQKKIQFVNTKDIENFVPWYRQSTKFTCGPASLMMAMASLNNKINLDQGLELDIWRESTTIFMTSGQAGCHPFGLALAAQQRGFEACVYINTKAPLFVDGVRTAHKKEIMSYVHTQFKDRCSAAEGIEIIYKDITQKKVLQLLDDDYAVIMLISTYQLDGKKVPHWVTVTSIDERCLFVHDPDPDDPYHLPIDCQNMPIAREDFEKMSAFGAGRMRTALAIKLVKQ